MRKNTTNTQTVDLLRELFHKLEEGIITANKAWAPLVLSAVVYQLPYIKNKWGEKPQLPNVITPNIISGQEAIEIARKSLGQFTWFSDQHPGTVLRIPGVIFVSEPVERLFESINETKEELHNAMKQFPAGSRARITGRVFKGVSMLQVYRKILTVNKTPDRITFTWAGNTSFNKIMTINETADYLKSKRDEVPSGMDQEEWEEVIKTELRNLNHPPPDTYIRIHREIAPHPRAMTFYDGIKTYKDMFHANLPIFIYVPEGTTMPIINLKPYDKNKRRKTRSDKRVQFPFIEKLNLYWVYNN